MNFQERKDRRKANNVVRSKAKTLALYKDVIKGIDFSIFPMETNVLVEKDIYLRIDVHTGCRDTGKPFRIETRRPLILSNNKKEIVDYIYWSLQNVILHEVAESFKVDGVRTYDPHTGRVPNALALTIDIPNKNWEGRSVVKGGVGGTPYEELADKV